MPRKPAKFPASEMKFIRDFRLAVDLPLYAQLAAFLRAAIKTGKIPQGKRMPPLRTIRAGVAG